MNIIPRMLITYIYRANIQFSVFGQKKAPQNNLEGSQSLLFIFCVQRL